MRYLNLFLFLLLIGCSDNNKYDKVELYKIATKVDPDVKLVLPRDLASGVTCQNYGEGCVRAVMVEHIGLVMIFVEYEDHEAAVKFGKSINSFVIRNWIVDDAVGEPVLEKFITTAFKEAKLAQDIPL